MAELWDIYDASGKKTGAVMERGGLLAPGRYHLVVHIWIRNSGGLLLIQKRAPHVEWSPGLWAATGGAAISGEDSLTAAIRETKEELGIDISTPPVKFISRVVRNTAFTDIWLATSDTSLGDLTLEDAVSDVKLVTADTLADMMKRGEFIDYIAHEVYSNEIMQELLGLS